MNFREATIEDISQMQTVRNSVKENVLSDPALVSYSDYLEYITQRGKGWVAEEDGMIIGFSVADLVDKNIWALFVLPGFEKKGIGKKLHELMLHWYFSQTKEPVWLSTAPRSRAESFYRKAGWKDVGFYGKGEIKFEMSYEDWCR
jgi:GNAT superfamily N-acetyltransferase